jgi:hypothetical protein
MTIFLCLLLIICGQGRKFEESSLVLDANFLRSYDTITVFMKDTTIVKAYDISITIRNNTDHLISFWMMKCSWEDNFLINNDYFYFIGRGCDGNYPYVVNLKPNERKILNSTIIKQNHTRYQQVETTRFGLIYIDKAHCENPFDFDDIIGDKSKHDVIIWSNSLYLNKK